MCWPLSAKHLLLTKGHKAGMAYCDFDAEAYKYEGIANFALHQQAASNMPSDHVGRTSQTGSATTLLMQFAINSSARTFHNLPFSLSS